MGQGLRHRCVIMPLLFNIFFAAAINVVYMHCKTAKDTMDALVHPRKKKGAGESNCWRASPGNAALGHASRGRCRGRLAIPRATKEEGGGNCDLVLGVWPRRIGDQD